MWWEQTQQPTHKKLVRGHQKPRPGRQKIGTNLNYSRMKDALKKGYRAGYFKQFSVLKHFLVRSTDWPATK